MQRTRYFIIAACVLTALAVDAVAVDESVGPFTAVELDRFLDVWPRLSRWSDEQGRDLDSVRNPSMLPDLLPQWGAGEFLRAEGWVPQRFYHVAGRVWMAALLASTRDEAPAMVIGIDQAIASVRSNPGLTAEQKQATISELGETKAMLLGLDSYVDVDPAEERLVADRLDRVLGVLGLE